MFGGFFAKPLAKFLRRFRLRIIFAVGCTGTHVGPFITDAWSHGRHPALTRSIQMLKTPAGIFVPLAIGALCVILVVICAPGFRMETQGKTNIGSKGNAALIRAVNYFMKTPGW